MGLKIGSLNISSIKVGSLGIDKIYQGTNVLYESTPPVPVNYIAKAMKGQLTNEDLEICLTSELTAIGAYALNGQDLLTQFYIPENVQSIGAFNAMNQNMLISTIKCMASIPPTLHSSAFGGSNTNYFKSSITKIQIPSGTLSAYQSANGWSTFTGTWEEI